MPNPIGVINVTLGNQSSPRVQSINYGQKTSNSIKNASDISMSGAQDGDVIVYQANTNSFVVEPSSQTLSNVDGGSF